MQRKQVDFKDIYDLQAVRIIVNKIATCYSTIGVVHGIWQYLPQEFDDYIANPKTNGYQSLHTVVFGPENAMTKVLAGSGPRRWTSSPSLVSRHTDATRKVGNTISPRKGASRT
jgi:hypothetical protein